MWIGPVVLIVSLAGGWMLVSRALRPMGAIARTAEQIQATDLSRRIDIRGSDELARLGKTLNDMLARLHESFDRQTRFTADASHELRTPLSVIAGNVELALKRPRPAEEYQDLLRDIGEAAERMTSTVEGLLTLARADAKSLPMRRDPVSLTVVADEVVRLCRPLAEKKGVTLSVESEGDVAVTADGERMRELVSNLVTNAIRYNRPQGKVTIRLRRRGGRAEVAVDDTGIGIPAEDLPHIFERFYRVDKARSREEGGSGLGLAIVKWIVDAHAGTISVTSEPGSGSRFVISLPA
jgi:heavy metal sensor kinase